MDIHERLNHLLEERGWSRFKLSKESGLSQETIGNIYKRGTVPSIATLQAICDGFKITLSQLFSENDMVGMTPELKQLFDEWVFLTPQQKDAIITVMKAMKNSSNKE